MKTAKRFLLYLFIMALILGGLRLWAEIESRGQRERIERLRSENEQLRKDLGE